MRFSKNIIRSFIDLPDHLSMMIYSIGCNLHCYQCFAYDSLIAHPIDMCDDNYILNQIKLNGYIYDAIIFSGGEFLNNNIDSIIKFLSNVKRIFNGILIINTNGSNPQKMEILNVHNLVDGFHTDMKLPYYVLDETKDKDIIKKIIGKNLKQSEINLYLQSIKNTIRFDKGYSQIRSVKYPQYDEIVFSKNKEYIQRLNELYGKSTKYYVNVFIDNI